MRPRRSAFSVRKERLRVGRQRGVELLHVSNGRLAATLCPTRGLGIIEAQCDGVRLGWDSPVREIVHPRHVNLARDGGIGWLDGFNEFVVRCGLQNIGRPGWDDAPAGRTMLTLHGKIANLPARAVRVRRTRRELVASGRVTERTAAGGVLELASEFSCRAGARGFTLRETITNRGARPEEFSILYHINVGPPLLGRGAQFLAPIRAAAPMNARAARRMATLARYDDPRAGRPEDVFALRLRGDRRGRTLVALVNPAGTRAVSLAFSLRELPCLTLWKQLGGAGERYVTGLEPGTNYPQHRRVERRQGRLRLLAPGEVHRMTIDFRVHAGAAEIRRLRRRIATLQVPRARGQRPRFVRRRSAHTRSELDHQSSRRFMEFSMARRLFSSLSPLPTNPSCSNSRRSLSFCRSNSYVDSGSRSPRQTCTKAC